MIKVDKQDKHLLDERTWTINTAGYAVSRIGGKLLYLHRVILNPVDGQMVDHINHDKLDNRRSNLRICTNRQNTSNQQLRSKNTSGYKGVVWFKDRQKWRAGIKVNYKFKHLGYFDDILEAAKAYDVAARKYFGEFAKLNLDIS